MAVPEAVEQLAVACAGLGCTGKAAEWAAEYLGGPEVWRASVAAVRGACSDSVLAALQRCDAGLAAALDRLALVNRGASLRPRLAATAIAVVAQHRAAADAALAQHLAYWVPRADGDESPFYRPNDVPEAPDDFVDACFCHRAASAAPPEPATRRAQARHYAHALLAGHGVEHLSAANEDHLVQVTILATWERTGVHGALHLRRHRGGSGVLFEPWTAPHQDLLADAGRMALGQAWADTAAWAAHWEDLHDELASVDVSWWLDPPRHDGRRLALDGESLELGLQVGLRQLLEGDTIDRRVAFTGCVDAAGQVTAVVGADEEDDRKLAAAAAGAITTVVLPADNRPPAEAIAIWEEAGLKTVYVQSVEQAVAQAMPCRQELIGALEAERRYLFRSVLEQDPAMESPEQFAAGLIDVSLVQDAASGDATEPATPQPAVVSWSQARLTPRVLVRGASGSGKTILLVGEALRHCGETLALLVGAPAGRPAAISRLEFAFYLDSRTLAGALPPGAAAKDLAPAVVKVLRERHDLSPATCELLERALHSGRLRLAIDTMERVPKHRVAVLWDCLGEWLRDHSAARLLVASRPVGEARPPAHWAAYFCELSLQPLTPEQIEAALGAWGGRAADALRTHANRHPKSLSILSRPSVLRQAYLALADRPATDPGWERESDLVELSVRYAEERWLERSAGRPPEAAERASLLAQSEMPFGELAEDLALGLLTLPGEGVVWSTDELQRRLRKLGCRPGPDWRLIQALEDAGLLVRVDPWARRPRWRLASRIEAEYLGARAFARTEDFLQEAHRHAWDPEWEGVLSLLGGLLEHEVLRRYLCGMMRQKRAGEDPLRAFRLAAAAAAEALARALPDDVRDALAQKQTDLLMGSYPTLQRPGSSAAVPPGWTELVTQRLLDGLDARATPERRLAFRVLADLGSPRARDSLLQLPCLDDDEATQFDLTVAIIRLGGPGAIHDLLAPKDPANIRHLALLYQDQAPGGRTWRGVIDQDPETSRMVGEALREAWNRAQADLPAAAGSGPTIARDSFRDHPGGAASADFDAVASINAHALSDNAHAGMTDDARRVDESLRDRRPSRLGRWRYTVRLHYELWQFGRDLPHE